MMKEVFPFGKYRFIKEMRVQFSSTSAEISLPTQIFNDLNGNSETTSWKMNILKKFKIQKLNCIIEIQHKSD